MTRYVLTDVQQASAELGRRAAELTGWLDSAALGYRPPPPAPRPGAPAAAAEMAVALADLACVRAVSAAAVRLTAAAEAMAACADSVAAVDQELGLRTCRWVG